MRLPLLLLLSICLSCAAPINQEPSAKRIRELTAKKFYSDLFTLYSQEKYGELFDALSTKFDKFFSGVYTEDDKKALRASFVKNQEEASEDFVFTIDPEIRKRVKNLFMKRLTGLNDEAQAFLMKAIEESASGITEVRQVVSQFRTKYDALDASTKKSLNSHFEIFNRLDEVQALITVADDIFRAVMANCDNTPEFKESAQCAQLKAAFN